MALNARLLAIFASLALPAAAVVSLTATDGPISAALARAPEPDATPKRWELRTKFSALRVLNIDIDGKSQAYYYLTYKVENHTGQDIFFAPAFDLVTADGAVTKSGKGVSDEATKKVIAYIGNSFIQDQIAILGPMLQGDENAKEGVVIWPADSLRPGELTVYASGFSGEAAEVKPPTSDASKGTPEKVVLRKTRSLLFKVPGEVSNIKDTPITVSEDTWVMR